jgi:hypothetical protein
LAAALTGPLAGLLLATFTAFIPGHQSRLAIVSPMQRELRHYFGIGCLRQPLTLRCDGPLDAARQGIVNVPSTALWRSRTS